MYIYNNYYYCNVNSITTDIYFINLLTYYVSSIMYYINVVIDYNKLYILIILLIIYDITKTEHTYPLKHSLGTALSPSLSSVYIYLRCKYIHSVSYETHRHGVWGNMDTPIRERRICDSVG